MPQRSTVLMVDDEADFLAAMGHWIRTEYEFVGLTSGADLLAQIEGLDPVVVVLDVRLPDVDGFELCRRIRSDRRFDALPILFLTGSRADEDFLRNIDAGGTAYLSKPVGRRQLLSAIRELTGEAVETVESGGGGGGD